MYLFISKHAKVVLFGIFGILCLYATYLYLTVGQRGYDDELVKLSYQFLQHNTALSIYNLPIRDVANYYNNYYVYFGPLASILLLPFVFLFHEAVPQVVVGIFAMITSYIAVFLIAKKFKFNVIDSHWLSLFFVFSTVLFSSSVINITAYQVEALGVPFVLFAIVSYLYKKPSLLTGIFIALAIMTRFTLIFAIIFFIVELIQKRFSLKSFLIMLIPIFIAGMILGVYNNKRFHSVLETGYNYNIALKDPPIGYNLKYGDKSIMHIPANLYSFLIMAPEPLLESKNEGMILKFPYLKANPWGIAIWFTSPLFILLIARFRKSMYTISACSAAIFLAMPVFLWYSIGFAQFGYRYSLDFLPFLFLMLLGCLQPKLSKTAIALIIVGVIFNCIYIDSIWEIYPIFNIYTH